LKSALPLLTPDDLVGHTDALNTTWVYCLMLWAGLWRRQSRELKQGSWSPGVAFCSIFQCAMLVFLAMRIAGLFVWLVFTLGALGAYVWLQPRVRWR
jgi:hypothetical protein